MECALFVGPHTHNGPPAPLFALLIIPCYPCILVSYPVFFANACCPLCPTLYPTLVIDVSFANVFCYHCRSYLLLCVFQSTHLITVLTWVA